MGNFDYIRKVVVVLTKKNKKKSSSCKPFAQKKVNPLAKRINSSNVDTRKLPTKYIVSKVKDQMLSYVI